MGNILSKGSMFPPELTKTMFNKVKGRSSLAKLSAAEPIPFNGTTEFTFSMDKEVDIVAENGKKTNGGVTIDPVTIVPIKFEYGTRVSDEFMTAAEEIQLEYLTTFADGFSKKIARGIDIAAMHGLNPRTGTASTVVGTNHFDAKVTEEVLYTSTDPDANVDDAVMAIQTADGDVNGLAMSTAFASALSKMKANGVRLYPDLAWGGNPGSINGLNADVNNTVAFGTSTTDMAIVGDFQNAFKWGYAKEIPVEVIPYGDPDNSGQDLKGHNQVYLRGEVYVGWGILVPTAFARVVSELSDTDDDSGTA